jgi:hypothetical protein
VRRGIDDGQRSGRKTEANLLPLRLTETSGTRFAAAALIYMQLGPGAVMKAIIGLLLGLVIGGFVGWYVHGFIYQDVRATDTFVFLDKLADPLPVLIARGTWRGASLANKVNTVLIECDALKMTCDMSQANVMSLTGGPFLSLDNRSFRITKLDTQSVIAETAQPDLCIRQTLTFDRFAKAVTYVRTKINREEVCSGVQEEPVTLFLGEPLR